IGSGFGIAVEPDPHLVFSHYGYGLLLTRLSRLVGEHAHGLVSLLSVGIGLGLFTFAVSRNVSTLAMSLLAAGGCVFLTAFLEPQFTVTAGLVFASAVACYLASVQRCELSLGSMFCICLAIILG